MPQGAQRKTDDLHDVVLDATVELQTRGRAESARRQRRALVSSFPSDSHTWNLVFLELLLVESGYDVVNLGSCVPIAHLVDESLRLQPDVVVLSSVNGHGHIEAREAIRALRRETTLAGVPVVVGGKLGVLGSGNARFTDILLEEGFDAVFTDNASPEAFTRYLQTPRSTSLKAGRALDRGLHDE